MHRSIPDQNHPTNGYRRKVAYPSFFKHCAEGVSPKSLTLLAGSPEAEAEAPRVPRQKP